MADKPIAVYMNDHLGGAMLGADLAQQIEEMSEGTPLGELMSRLAPQIEDDRQTLTDLMERMDISRNPVKQATSWVAEKAARVKFAGATPGGDAELGTFMALETLTLGVEGKASMWRVLQGLKADYPVLADTDLDALLDGATVQHDQLERERVAFGQRLMASQEVAGADT
jgi:hypothetical protein